MGLRNILIVECGAGDSGNRRAIKRVTQETSLVTGRHPDDDAVSPQPNIGAQAVRVTPKSGAVSEQAEAEERQISRC